MKYVIIGSSAMRYNMLYVMPDTQEVRYLYRKPKDHDVMSTEKIDLPGFDTIIVPQNIIDLIKHKNGYATVDSCYTIKKSHLMYDINWQKHKHDYIEMKFWYHAEIIPELFEALMEYWKQQNGNKKFLSLYKTKKDFFDDNVNYVYDHDELHKAVAFPDEPVYTLCLKDGEEVAIDKSKFFNLSFDKQLRMFQEEISVIAAERWMIPEGRNYHWIKAYSLALHKTVTSLTKNWASLFIIDNLDWFVKPNKQFFINLAEKGYIKMPQTIISDWKNEIILSIMNEYQRKNDEDIFEEVSDSDLSEFVYEAEFYDKELDNFKVLEEVGGGEGDGEYAHLVFEYNGECYKLTYSYYSHYGRSFDDAELQKVTPVEKMVTVYE